jgi:hypothetical protein
LGCTCPTIRPVKQQQQGATATAWGISSKIRQTREDAVLSVSWLAGQLLRWLLLLDV